MRALTVFLDLVAGSSAPGGIRTVSKAASSKVALCDSRPPDADAAVDVT
jgi:hypothetical protein